jgi:hypothetical protein
MGYPLLSGGNTLGNLVDPHEYWAKLTFGASSVASVQSREIAVSRVSAGKYQVTLPKNYRTFCYLDPTLIDPVGAVLFVVVQSETVSTDGKLVFELRTETGTATDPDSGSQLAIKVGVSDHPMNDATV